MNNQERFVKWKCPECGNYHKWVWDIYDIFGGEIAMTCDNPECGRTSKMYMVVEKNGNATALVADNSQVEATEKVMNSQKEIDISRVLIEGNIATIMGEKYKRVEEPPTLYDKLETWIEYGNFAQSKDVLANEILNIVKEIIPEPFKGMGLPEYFMGYNEAIRKIVDRLE